MSGEDRMGFNRCALRGEVSCLLANAEERVLAAHRTLLAKIVSRRRFLALAGAVAMLAWSIRRKKCEDALLLAFLFAALVGNATICGVLSGPHDRYQSRLMWLPPFALCLLLRNSVQDIDSPDSGGLKWVNRYPVPSFPAIPQCVPDERMIRHGRQASQGVSGPHGLL